jgi:hypothetical protein
MANVRTGRYCSYCDAMVTATQRQPNHILHLLLAVFTLGLWLPVWLFIAIASGWEPLPMQQLRRPDEVDHGPGGAA